MISMGQGPFSRDLFLSRINIEILQMKGFKHYSIEKSSRIISRLGSVRLQ